METKVDREKLTRLRANAALTIIEQGRTAMWLKTSGLMSEKGARAVGKIVEQYSLEEIQKKLNL